MTDLFGNPDAAPVEYPPDALCAVEKCGHEYAKHTKNACARCVTNAQRGFAVDAAHEFRPRLLGGKVVTPSTERELLEKAQRGE